MERLVELIRKNLRAGRPLDHGIEPLPWQRLLDRYSHFVDRRDADGFLIDSELVLTDLHTPRPSLHLMLSTHDGEYGQWGSFWDQFGGGFSCLDSVLAGRMTSHLDTNYVPTAPEPQDCRGFYIHDNGDAWPIFPVPHFQEDAYQDVECIQGLDRHVMRAERQGLACALEVCVHPEWPLETWVMRITNRRTTPAAFSWFCRARVNVDSFPSYYFVPRVVCEGLHENDVLVFLNHDKGNKHPRYAFFTAAPDFSGFDMMGEVFDGVGGRSPIPAVVVAGKCRDSLGLQPYAGLVAAAQFRVELQPGETREWHCAYGACPYEPTPRRKFIRKIRTSVLADNDVPASVRKVWQQRIGVAVARTPDDDLDRYYNVWSKYQGRNQSRFCRALDKIGYRDVLQDLMSVCASEPGYVRKVLLRTLRYQAADGRAVRQYCLFPQAGHDLRMYMDSSSWIADTLVDYVKETGDRSVLDEPVPWFDLERSQPDESCCGTVYEHALQSVRSLAQSTGFHGLCRIGYGDWNDALSGIGGERGVSAWLSMACVWAAQRLAELATWIGRTDDAGELTGIARTMTQRINDHAWDGQWYIYAINGEGRPVGSHCSAEGRIHLNVNTWALFTGVARAAGREEQVWQSLETLATPFGHMLIAPPYTSASRADCGRIADQKPGMFENGSIYMHGEAFFLYALIATGRSDECYRQLLRTLPSRMIQDITTCPRHQQSNFTVGPDHPSFGTQLFSNFTGSVPWYRRVIETMLGVTTDFDALRIRPRPPQDWPGYEVARVWRGRQIRIRCRRDEEATGQRTTLGNREYTDRIPLADLSEGRVNDIDAVYGLMR